MKALEAIKSGSKVLKEKNISTFILDSELLLSKSLNKSREEILKPLRIVRQSLEENQNETLASGELLDLMRRAKCFGINLARLDIRQESSRHSQLISEYVKKRYKKNYLTMSEEEKIQLLKKM